MAGSPKSADDGTAMESPFGEPVTNGLNGHAPEADIGMRKRDFEIIDIRRDHLEHSLRADILSKLQPANGEEKQLPTLLLYDEAGLKLFEEITYLDEYYLTNAELEVLEDYADAIAQRIRPGSILVELGSGNLRKVKILLDALERIGRDVQYHALDLSISELRRTLAQVPSGAYQHVRCFGLHGTYDDGLAWLLSPERHASPKCVLWLGSSIGNFSREEAAGFLRSFTQVLQSGDTMLVGVDACKDKDKVYRAYNDEIGLTHRFIRNGLSHANRILGRNVFNPDDWTVIGEYDENGGRHQAFYSPRKDLSFDNIKFKAGELVRVEESNKYSVKDRLRLWMSARLTEGAEWGNRTGEYHLHMLYKPVFSFSLKPEEYAAGPVPGLQDWAELWAAWDAVMRHMLPETELLSKPISLRHPSIFYLGHVPTFLDMHLARATDGALAVPSHYAEIFERGIDPDVEDPARCHAHSKVPASWPTSTEINAVQTTVRDRLSTLYKGHGKLSSRLSEAIWLGFEHEAMHLETMLYILLQGETTRSPPGSIRPDFRAVAREAELEAVENQWFTIPESDLEIGLDDHKDLSEGDGFFGWDNEKPRRQVTVHSFQAKARPISIGEYAHYLEQTRNGSVPASWTVESVQNGSLESANGGINGVPNGDYTNGTSMVSQQYLRGKLVKTVFGLVPLADALHWPVAASYNELVGCAVWMGGRIPTLEEVRSIYHYVDQKRSDEAPKVLPQTIAAVNGHLSNEGVEETPPSDACRQQSSTAEPRPNPSTLFADLEGCNVGFTHWHPVPVTQNGARLCGQGDLGGVWEWTSTVLEEHEGFQPMELYPAYTADFFDGKHNIMQGGSWATHPRIAGRRTFINWYQRSYPYVWAGARLVRDI